MTKKIFGLWEILVRADPSEIYYDHGDHLEGDPPKLGNEPGDRFVEIWNVFTQFDK